MWSRLSKDILCNHEKTTQLLVDGYCVMDNCLEEDIAAALLEEMMHLEKGEQFLPNQVEFSVPGTKKSFRVTKPGIFEVDLHDKKKALKNKSFLEYV